MPNSLPMNFTWGYYVPLRYSSYSPLSDQVHRFDPSHCPPRCRDWPVSFASHVRRFTFLWPCSTMWFRYLHCRSRQRRRMVPSFL